MKVYKYRGVLNNDNLKRDLKTFLNNEFYASKFDTMNDKFEANFDEIITDTVTYFEKVFNIDATNVKKGIEKIIESKNKLGIYCLSKTYKNETLWAYYADNNKGYCIEYDLEKLKDKTRNLDFFSVADVNYTDNKPVITVLDINSKNVINKMFATKKKRWSQEEEIRLLFDNFGLKKHHQSAITAIYFGCDSSDELIENLISEFDDRDIDFYRMITNFNSNEFERKLIHKNVRKLNFNIDKFNYKLVKTIDNPVVTNYYLYTEKEYDLQDLKELSLAFKEKYSYKNCNIYFINNLEVIEIIEKYPKDDNEYIKFAESIIADFPFDCDGKIFPYPFKDWKYKELISKYLYNI